MAVCSIDRGDPLALEIFGFTAHFSKGSESPADILIKYAAKDIRVKSFRVQIYSKDKYFVLVDFSIGSTKRKYVPNVGDLSEVTLKKGECLWASISPKAPFDGQVHCTLETVDLDTLG